MRGKVSYSWECVVARMEAGGHGGNAVSCDMCVNWGGLLAGERGLLAGYIEYIAGSTKCDYATQWAESRLRF